MMAAREKPTTVTLRKAREQIAAPNGWTKQEFLNEQTGAMCLLGAIRWAICGDAHNWNIGYKRPLRLLSEVVPGRNIVGFNDASRTRKQDVIAALDRAIELSESRRY